MYKYYLYTQFIFLTKFIIARYYLFCLEFFYVFTIKYCIQYSIKNTNVYFIFLI